MGPEPDSLGVHPNSVTWQLRGPRPVAYSLCVLGSSSQVQPCHLPRSKERDRGRGTWLCLLGQIRCSRCPVLLGGSLTFCQTVTLEILVCEPGLHEGPQRNPERGLRFLPGFSGGAGAKAASPGGPQAGGSRAEARLGIGCRPRPWANGKLHPFFFFPVEPKSH